MRSLHTLKSIFVDGIAPPEVDFHIRIYNVAKDVLLRAPTSMDPAWASSDLTAATSKREAKEFSGRQYGDDGSR